MRAGWCVTLVTLALGLSGGAFAQSQDEQIMKTGPSGGTDTPPPAVDDEELSSTYSSVGLQKVHAKFDNVKDSINLDLVAFGFRIPTVPWFAVELNLSIPMIPGQVDQSSSSAGSGGTCITPGLPPGCTPASSGNTTTSSSDFSPTTAAVYAVLRSTGKFFVMGKYGYRYLNASLNELQNDRSGDAFGAGFGYRWNKKGSYAELGYVKLADKVDAIGFSLSYSYDRR